MGQEIILPRLVTRLVRNPKVLLYRTIAALLWLPAGVWAQYYDLGGPCVDRHNPLTTADVFKAQKNGDWPRAVDLQKLVVRDGCGIEARWYQLVTLLLKARREQEAVRVLEEMDARGFDLNPSSIGQHTISPITPEIEKFMSSAPFKASPVGTKIDSLEQISSERRTRFRELLKTLPAGEKPPDDYIAKGACPFECCRYGNWMATQDTDLVASPGSKRIVRKVRAGTRATGVTGEVHLKPEPVAVLTDVNSKLPKDSIAFILDYEGEGFGNVYSHGKVVHDVFFGYGEYCFRISKMCWGETLLPRTEQRQPVWWVEIRLPDGLIGWTDRPDNFDGKDACGH